MKNYSAETPPSWDMGVSGMIEETPFINPRQPTHFRKVKDAHGDVHLYLKRPEPSWANADA